MRLIDADELKTAFPCGESVRTESVRATIDHMPTVEAVPVVRCKDCKSLIGNEQCLAWTYEFLPADGYCYLGKRRDDA